MPEELCSMEYLASLGRRTSETFPKGHQHQVRLISARRARRTIRNIDDLRIVLTAIPVLICFLVSTFLLFSWLVFHRVIFYRLIFDILNIKSYRSLVCILPFFSHSRSVNFFRILSVLCFNSSFLDASTHKSS